MSRPARRYSLKLALADVRRAIGTNRRSDVRYARNHIAARKLELAHKLLVEVERLTREAVAVVLAGAERKRRAA